MAITNSWPILPSLRLDFDLIILYSSQLQPRYLVFQELSVMRLTASRLATFDQCRLKYHYTYHLRIPRPNLNSRTVLGIVVHKALEIFYGEFNKQSMILPTLGWLEEAYERAWSEHRKEIDNDEYLK